MISYKDFIYSENANKISLIENENFSINLFKKCTLYKFTFLSKVFFFSNPIEEIKSDFTKPTQKSSKIHNSQPKISNSSIFIFFAHKHKIFKVEDKKKII